MNWLPYLPSLFFLLLAVYIWVKEPRATSQSRRPSRIRYRVQWVSAILVFAVLVLFTVDIVMHGFNLRRGSAIVAIGVWLGLSIWQLRRHRPQAPAEPPAPPLKRRPSFLWQAVLILLPVAIMAAIGLAAIVRDRSAVENEAKQRAEEILRSLPAEFGRGVASRINEFSAISHNWSSFQQNIWAVWPEHQERKSFLTNNAGFLKVFEAWHAAFPDLRAEEVLPVQFSFNGSGELQNIGYRNPPEPPAWFVALTPEQGQAWLSLVQAESQRGSNIALLVEAFLRTGPPPEARACAEFTRLRDELQARPVTNAVEKLIRFTNRGADLEAESGVPLSNLALAEALRQARETGLNELLWEKLLSEVADRPSVLTPSLLDEAQLLVAHDAGLSEALKALRALWEVDQARRELAGAVKRTGKVNGITTTNLWLDALERRWFCTLQPNEQITHTHDTNHNRVTLTNTLTEVRPYVKPLVAHGFAEALRDARVALPDYFGISVVLEGEPIALPAPWGKNRSGQPPGEILAETSVHMWLPATLDETPIEFMPSHPGFVLRIHLVDRNLLFAAHRQRTLLFGGLIIASAFAALTGAFAARRAFNRQLGLNEMKSNFVSSVSHELRAPIASVRLMAESLERGKVSEPSKQNEYFRFIVQECRRLSSLIENVLDFSRIEQGRKQYEFEPTDLAALTRETVKLMEPYAAEKGVRLELNAECGVRSAELELDGRAIQQALVNLIDNAVKHSAKGETVTVKIEVRSPESRVQSPQLEPGHPPALATSLQPSAFSLSVTDHGPGIPPEEHEKIFERFYRLGSELRRETQGVGIGLSIVKHIVDAHGGRVIVRSAVGQGSRFTIELPEKRVGTADKRR